MNFKELVEHTQWDTIIGPLTELIMTVEKCSKAEFESKFTLDPFRKVFMDLHTIVAMPKDEGILCIEHVHEEHVMDVDYEDPDTGTNLWIEDYDEVYALFPKEDPGQKYGLELTAWEEWLGLDMDEHTMNEYSPGQIMAHCLWEMTFFGFKQDDIKDKLDELTTMTEKVKTCTWEEVFGEENHDDKSGQHPSH